jgi:hypothetical protein
MGFPTLENLSHKQEYEMKFINVAMGTKFEDKVTCLTGNTLASIWSLIKYQNFKMGTFTHKDRKKKLLDYIKNIIQANKSIVTIDSGGYSIIKGEIPFDQISLFEEYYLHILEEERDKYDMIFTLDIPWGANDLRLQNAEIIDALNFRSLKRTFEVLERNPELRDKLFYVYHFKTEKQYRIWQKHYQEMDIGSRITHRAVGGLVGLKGNAMWVRFTPFTIMLYKCLYDYLDAGFEVPELKIHVLGVYIPRERFVIALVEKIFNKFLEENKIETKLAFTYDSVNYARESIDFPKTMHFWDYQNKTLSRSRYHGVPDHILNQVYGNDVDDIKAEIQNLLQGKKRNDTSSFIPLSVNSQIQLDQFLMDIVDKHDVINKLDISSYTGTVKSRKASENPAIALAEELEKQYQKFELFSLKKLIKDLEYIRGFTAWLFHNQDPHKLEEIIRGTITAIDYPYYLT